MLESNNQGKISYRGTIIKDGPHFLATLKRASQYEFPRDAGSDEVEELLEQAEQEKENIARSRDLFRKGFESQYRKEQNIYIEQGFAAFSDRTPLQVENLGSCIFLIICDPNSHFCVGMHIDYYIAKEGIDRMIKQFLLQLPTAIPEHQHRNYSLKVHIMGGDSTSSVILQSIYSVLSQYTIELSLLHLTLVERIQKSRPINIAFNPINQQFYSAIVPFTNSIKKDSAIYFTLYHQIHQLNNCLLFNCKDPKMFTIQQISQMTSCPHVLVCYQNILYAVYVEEHSIEELLCEEGYKSDLEAMLPFMQAIKEDSCRMATPDELKLIAELFIPKKNINAVASDKQGIFKTFPIAYPQEALERIRMPATYLECNDFYVRDLNHSTYKVYYTNFPYYYSMLYLQRPYQLLSNTRPLLSNCFFSGPDNVAKAEPIVSLIEEYLGSEPAP